MDYFAHGFWSYIIFHKIKKPLYAVTFGLLPDTLSWGIYFFYNIFTGQLFGRPRLEIVPNWVFDLYGISHSLFVWGFIALLVYIIFRENYSYIYAALIAILMDIPTHSREFLPTPFLWPFSNWKFPGFSWGNGWFMLINYSLIITCLVYILLKKRRR